MPPKAPAPEPPAPAKSSSTMLFLIVAGIVVLVAAIAGLLVYQFVLSSRLDPNAAATETPAAPDNSIPAETQTIEFDQMQAAVRPDGPNEMAPILIFKVAVAVNNAQAAAFIDAHRAWFISEISDMHQFRTRSELQDPATKQAILRQLKQAMDKRLAELSGTSEYRVVRVMHTAWTVIDQ